MIYEITPPTLAQNLFGDWQETLIWSCLQGTMGRIYGDDPESPQAAMAILADFCFFAGEPNQELVRFRPEWCKKDFMIYVPQNDAWAHLIQETFEEEPGQESDKDSVKEPCRDQTKAQIRTPKTHMTTYSAADQTKKIAKRLRYAIKKETEVFDPVYLRSMVAQLPPEYTLTLMTESLFAQCKKIPWCNDFVGQYETYPDFEKAGVAALILKDGEILSGASSYTSYLEGIEIEIDTREDFRRKGLATICGAALILECLGRGLYPSWDAQNLWSVALAEKLGYHFDHEYVVYEVSSKA